MEQSMTCDKELLECIANNYKFDNRFKNYFNKFSNEDFSDFVYQEIMYYCQNMQQ
ncbi:TipAS antibiotic-recognition domain-containing protein [Clostridium rhizosphaerae]|uniref:TipAS antibiotic-recognition domain-containing protein n=1 Tax=Clostridium rhizosphaerae TaxID=2803861 RepID=UPI001FAEB71B|nr:TipAS antibiotic-recognition domain-containing protein [Clostridium rhizosphaerae]